MKTLEVIAYILIALSVITFIAFIIAWACMSEQQFKEIDKQIEEMKKRK